MFELGQWRTSSDRLGMFQAKGAFRLLFFEARAVWVLKRGREDWEGRAGGETAVLINPLSLISARRAGLEGLPFE